MAWMAWTWPTAVFFIVIATTLTIFTLLAIKFPETPRKGVLQIETTRGDRLFIHTSRLCLYKFGMAGSGRREPTVRAIRLPCLRFCGVPLGVRGGLRILRANTFKMHNFISNFRIWRERMTFPLKSSTAIVLSLGMLSTPVFADMDAAKAFLDSEIGDLSVLPRGEQEAEMQFFCRCSQALRRHGDQSCV